MLYGLICFILFAFTGCVSTEKESVSAEKECVLDQSTETIIKSLFFRSAYLYSLLWWEAPESKTISARTFVINGHDSVPIFVSESEAKVQVAGSGFENDLVRVNTGLLADILQGIEYAVLNPGGDSPIQFKTCAIKQFAKGMAK